MITPLPLNVKMRIEKGNDAQERGGMFAREEK